MLMAFSATSFVSITMERSSSLTLGLCTSRLVKHPDFTHHRVNERYRLFATAIEPGVMSCAWAVAQIGIESSPKSRCTPRIRMLKYEYLKKEWIVSPSARRIYRISASLSLALFFGMWLTFFEGGIPELMAAVARLLFFAGALGAGITLVGMEFFLFRFDDSHPLKQAIWFCIMLFPLIGAALYCFTVYSRSDAHERSSAKRAQGVPV